MDDFALPIKEKPKASVNERLQQTNYIATSIPYESSIQLFL
jgi:hypothetical protein